MHGQKVAQWVSKRPWRFAHASACDSESLCHLQACVQVTCEVSVSVDWSWVPSIATCGLTSALSQPEVDLVCGLTGEGLCGLLRQEGRADTAKALCQEVTGRAAAAGWAWRLLGFYHLEGGQHEKAVQCFQTSLRGDVKCAAAWEGLGSAYQSLARLTAALKVLNT